MPPGIDMVGQRFGRLVVQERAGSWKRQWSWRCLCDCGTTSVVPGHPLRAGHTKSCGCLLEETRGQSSVTHGLTDTAMYRRWSDIKTRCFNPNSPAYHNYGGRGVTMHSSWADDFAQFLADVGEPPFEGATLDRIDNDGDYAPGNVRWATKTEQNRNRRDSLYIEYDGETRHIKEWAADLGMDYLTLQQRIRKYGWSPEKALTTPVKPHPLRGKKLPR